jgi:hypothetical protein
MAEVNIANSLLHMSARRLIVIIDPSRSEDATEQHGFYRGATEIGSWGIYVRTKSCFGPVYVCDMFWAVA